MREYIDYKSVITRPTCNTKYLYAKYDTVPTDTEREILRLCTCSKYSEYDLLYGNAKAYYDTCKEFTFV